MSNKPITRKQMFMAKASGENVNTPEPITREEKYLDKIAKNIGKATSWKDLVETTVGDTLTWDGNTEGLYSVLDTFYLVSNIVPTMEELQNGGTITADAGGKSVTVSFTGENLIDTNTADMGTDVILVNADDIVVLIATKDGATLITEGLVSEYEKAGVYFLNVGGNVVGKSFTINGYTGFPKEQIKEEYLPGFNTIKRVIEIDPETNIPTALGLLINGEFHACSVTYPTSVSTLVTNLSDEAYSLLDVNFLLNACIVETNTSYKVVQASDYENEKMFYIVSIVGETMSAQRWTLSKS